MPAASSNKFKKSFAFLSKTLSSGISAGDTSAPLSDVNNIPTDTAVDFVVDRVDSNGAQTPSKREIMTGIVSGSSIISLLRGRQGTTAQSHNTSAIVEFNVSAQTHNDMVDGILNQHTQTGTHQAITNTGGMTTDSLNVSGASSLNGAVSLGSTLSVAGAITGAGFSAATLTNPYKFHAYRNGAWTGNSGKIDLDTEVFDTNNNFDTATNFRYTAPVNGFYQINFSAGSAQSAGTGYGVNVTKNGGGAIIQGSRVIATQTTSFVLIVGGSGILQLTAGDYLELSYIGGASVTGATGPETTFMSGFLVSAT